jgi:hypothetical protein
MATKTKTPTRKPSGFSGSPARTAAEMPAAAAKIPPQLQDFLKQTSIPKDFVAARQIAMVDLRRRLIEINLKPTVPLEQLLSTVNRIKPADVPEEKMPEDVRESVRALKPGVRRFHGTKVALSWFPFLKLTSACADRFGYMSSAATRAATKLPFNVATQALLGQLGNLM